MAQAQLPGGSTPRSQLEEDQLLGYDSASAATASTPTQEGEHVTEDSVMDTDDSNSTSTVDTTMLGGLNTMTLEGEGSVQQAPTGQQEQQYLEDVPLPLTSRTPEGTAAVLQKWINMDYMCPYPSCGFVPPGCRRDGRVMRPDRWSDFTDHWFTHHMSPTLLLVCQKDSCNRFGKVYYSCKQYSGHLKSHHAQHTDAQIVQEPLQQALDEFAAAVGPEAAYSAIKAKVTFPSHHLSWRQMSTKPQVVTSTETTSTATVTVSTTATATPITSTSSETSSRRSRSDAGTSHKREASRATSSRASAAKRPKNDMGPDKLSMGRGVKELPKSAIIEVSAAMSGIRDNFMVRVGETLTSSTSAMIRGHHKCEIVCAELDKVRTVCNDYIDTLDADCYSFATWQKQLGSKPAPTPPSKRLVSANVIDDSRRLAGCQTQLTKTLEDNKDLRKKVAALEADVLRLKLVQPQPVLGHVAAASSSVSTPKTLGGSSRVVNRPGTTLREVDLLSEQLSNLWSFVQEHR